MPKYNNILKFYEDYCQLEQIKRTGWVMREVPAERLESVGDHTLQTVMLASVLARELNIEIDLLKLMEMLMIHDIGEIKTGDVASVDVDAAIKKQNEYLHAYEILSSLSADTRDYYYSLWEEMNKKETDLAKFAYCIDKIDAVIKAGLYERQYNLSDLFSEFYEYQKNKQTFNGSLLDELFEYLEKYQSMDNNSPKTI